jgi:hypothetical protein
LLAGTQYHSFSLPFLQCHERANALVVAAAAAVAAAAIVAAINAIAASAIANMTIDHTTTCIRCQALLAVVLLLLLLL